MARKSFATTFGMGFLCLVIIAALLNFAGARSTHLSYTLTLPEEQVVITGAPDEVQLGVEREGFFTISDEGAPTLPVTIIDILLPQGERYESFTVRTGESRVLLESVQLVRGEKAVAEDGTVGKAPGLFGAAADSPVFPPVPVRYLGTGTLHGYAIASFAVSPLRYEDGTVLLTEQITVSVQTARAASGDRPVTQRRFKEGFLDETRAIISSMVENPGLIDDYHFDQVVVPKNRGGFRPSSAPSLEGSPVEYLIITSEEMAEAYQQVADWKTRKGVPAVVKTVEWIQQNYRNGVDLPETIRLFIREAYEKWGVKWVLLGGDTDVIPARYAFNRFYNGGTEVPTDLYFACLDGSWNDTHDSYWGEGVYYVVLDDPDLYADVYVGRLPTSKAVEVNQFYDKLVSYTTPLNRDYTENMLLLAEVLFPVDWEPGKTIQLNGADLAQYLYMSILSGKPINVTRSFETWDLFPGSIPETRQATIDSMNAGMGIVNHIGHGFRFVLSVAEGSVLSYDADALTNTDEYFLLYMLNCTAVAFDYFCLGEHFLKNPSGGAISVIGASRSAYPNASQYYMDEYFDLLFNQDVVHVGETFARSRLPRTPYAAASDNIDLWTHYIYTMLSDPELPIWTSAVDTLDVTYASNVGLGDNSILVTVQQGGSPVDSAFVCLYKGEEDYEYGSTDGAGTVTFNFTCESPGSVSVVVTGRNHARHQGYIVVDASANPYLSYASLLVDDDDLDGTFGNNNGVIEAGETIDLKLYLLNTGGATASTVSAKLRTSHPSIVISDSTANFGTIDIDELQLAADEYRIVVPVGLDDQTPVDFTLEITNTVLVWEDSFRKLVHAPGLELLTLRIDDSEYGNDDGIVDANERFKLYCKLKNYGTGQASELSATLADLDGAFTFYDHTDSYGNLPAQVAGENLAGFDIEESSVGVEHYLELTVTDLFGNTIKDTMELRRPDPPTNLAFDASIGVDKIKVSWIRSLTADVAKYNIYHSLDQGGPYTLRSLDPAEHSVFMDENLSPSTRYYYVITAIDSSGNESDFSLESFVSTNPPQLIGWPIEMMDWTSSSPVVGDIDGDYDLEVVQGNTYLYAWHHDGVELIDGDADPQSWGVFSTLGQDYVAPAALADIDAVPGLDIIAISWSTYEVYCFTYQGTVIAGWPKTTETNARCAPVIADLDGDGDWEVIVVDQAGVIYAWHHDGSEYRDGDGIPETDGVFHRLPAIGGWHYQAPAVCDIDHDSQDELIVGSVIDSIWVFNEDGSQVPGWPVAINGSLAGSIPVGDADLDGEIEILVAAKSTSEVKLFNHDGTLRSGWPRWISSNLTYNPSVAMADVTGDAHLEIVMASSNKRIYLIDYLGADVPGWPIYYSSTTYTESSPVIADINGDGSPDIVLGDEAKYINAWDADGMLLDGFPIAVADAVRGTPAIADLDSDGDGDLIVAGWDRTLYVWDFPEPYLANDALWPMFHNNYHRNGLAGFRIMSAIQDVTFSYQLAGESVELSWIFPLSAGYQFDLYRSAVDEDAAGAFVKISGGINPDDQGSITYTDRDVDPGERYVYRLVALTSGNEQLETGEIYVPISRAALNQNYPNPFNPTTTIVFYVPDGGAQRVSLRVYDVNGALVKTLVNDVLTPDRYEYQWDGRNNAGDPVGSGVYFYQLVEKGFSATRKMVLLK